MMAFNWEELLKTFGGQAILLAAVGYLIKTLVSNRFERDAEAFKADLKRNSDIEIERLKNVLQMAAIEHQVRFSKLHEQRAEIIGKLSQMIEEAPTAVGSLLRNLKDKELLARARTTTVDLGQCVQVNRVIFPDDLCQRLDGFWRILYMMVLSADVYWNDVETPPPDVVARQEKVLIENLGRLGGEIPRLKNNLIEDLRNLLAGGSN